MKAWIRTFAAQRLKALALSAVALLSACFVIGAEAFSVLIGLATLRSEGGWRGVVGGVFVWSYATMLFTILIWLMKPRLAAVVHRWRAPEKQW